MHAESVLMGKILRGLTLALQLMTRLPLPQLKHVEAEELQRSAHWFPAVGIIIGIILMMLLTILTWAAVATQIIALLLLIVWVAITGALHLDGAADLADALGASHRDPDRLLAVLKDPHSGSFAIVALLLILLTKWVALTTLLQQQPAETIWLLLLIPAWTRLAALHWSCTLPPLQPTGLACQYSTTENRNSWLWGVLLLLLTIWLLSLSFALLALLWLWGWRYFLQWRLGGMNGDCLGAGIEYGECALLLAAAIAG